MSFINLCALFLQNVSLVELSYVALTAYGMRLTARYFTHRLDTIGASPWFQRRCESCGNGIPTPSPSPEAPEY